MTKVLFVCKQNAGRSQMSEALFGLAAQGRHEGDPLARLPPRPFIRRSWTAMGELGIDLADRIPRELDRADAEWADVVVTMGCGDACPYIPGTRYVDWELSDPAGRSVDEVRAIRDEIADLIDDLVAGLDGARHVGDR